MSMNAVKTLPASIPPAKGFFAKGKAVVKFYKTGVVNVWQNRKANSALCRKYNASSPSQLIQEYLTFRHLGDIQTEKPKQALAITREQLLTLERTPRDFVKLPLFAVILAVFFEFTPAVLYLFPRISPTTCFGEKFRSKLRDQYIEQRNQYKELTQNADNFHEAVSVHKLTRGQLVGLSCTVLPGVSWLYKLAPTNMLKNRVLSHLKFVRADDYFLRENDLEKLTEEEAEAACRARALDISKDHEARLSLLKKWAEEFKEPADVGFFARD